MASGEPVQVFGTRFILTYRCPDKEGLFAAVYRFLNDSGAFVVQSSHHTDTERKVCFHRTLFEGFGVSSDIQKFRDGFSALADRFKMEFRIVNEQHKPRVLIAVSKHDHCLNVLLTKWRSGGLPIDISAVVSNHDNCRGLVEWHGISYHHYPVSKVTKSEQEKKILALMDSTGSELLVLARYMQILSPHMCNALENRAINIHHSFLPSFKGAKPYHQAFEHGVKLIGATAHYVTPDLDEGPIIAQNVKTVTHAHDPRQMILYGHDIEATTLSEALKLHAEGRVWVNGKGTVVL